MPEIQQINRLNDYAFKRILGSEDGKEALLGFLNAVLDLSADKKLTHVQLSDKELIPEYLLGKTARLDILAETADGILINIEVQIIDEHDIDQRILYYWARLYSEQLNKGKKYKELKKTISIVVMDFDWFKDDERYYRSFQIRDTQTNELFSDLLEIHIMEVKKLKEITMPSKDKLIDWLVFFNNIGGDVMEQIAQENPAIKKAISIEELIKKDANERRLYLLQEKFRMEQESFLEGALLRGKTEGKTEGKIEGKIEVAKELILMRLDTEQIAKATGVSREKIRQWKKELM